MSEAEPQWRTVGDDARRIAIRKRAGAGPGLFWLGGFRSDMIGTKAEALDALAARKGLACTRFDYSGHGESEGAFTDGTIGRWLEDAVAVFRAETAGPQVVVGSSMGGWIALLLARTLLAAGEGDRLKALVLIAPAPDFTEELMWANFGPAERDRLETEGVLLLPNEYGDEPTPITRALIEDGRNHLVLGEPIETGCPVHILQGVRDPDVPYAHALRLVDGLAGEDVVVTLIKDGDHRLSRPEDLERLSAIVSDLVG